MARWNVNLATGVQAPEPEVQETEDLGWRELVQVEWRATRPSGAGLVTKEIEMVVRIPYEITEIELVEALFTGLAAQMDEGDEDGADDSDTAAVDSEGGGVHPNE